MKRGGVDVRVFGPGFRFNPRRWVAHGGQTNFDKMSCSEMAIQHVLKTMKQISFGAGRWWCKFNHESN